MIEIICRENLQKGEQDAPAEKRCMPKNIRQVGSPRGRHKIYIEDYVYTYIQGIARKKGLCAAVFLGTAQVDKDIRYTFVSGAVECGAAAFQWDNIQLDDSFWDYIYKEKKQYFPDLEVVGWFLGKGGLPMELPASVESAHRKYFAGRDKLLMLMDTLEGEEIFFVHEQGYLQKREGYYIYYEKNLPMQEYMVSKREEEQQWDRLAGWEKGTGFGAAAQADRAALEETGDAPRTGEFAALYQELQDEPMGNQAQQKAEGSFQSLMQAVHSGQKEGAARGKRLMEKEAQQEAPSGRSESMAPGKHVAEREGLQKENTSKSGEAFQEAASDLEEGLYRENTSKDREAFQGAASVLGGSMAHRRRPLEKENMQEGVSGLGENRVRKRHPQEKESTQEGVSVLGENMARRKRLLEKESMQAEASVLGEALQKGKASRNKKGMQEGAPGLEEGLRQRYASKEREALQEAESGLGKFRGQPGGLLAEAKGKGKGQEQEEGQEAPWGNIFAKNNRKEEKTPAEEALESYRNMVLERHGRQIARQNRNFLYTASAFFLVVLCVMGISTINNYRKMQKVEETLHILKAKEGEGGSPKEGSAGQEGLVVESIASEVEPLEEKKENKEEDKASDLSGKEGAKEPSDTAEAVSPQTERARYYTVQPGDTLDTICLSIYNSLDVREELCQLNDIEDGNKIFTGQKLKLP